MEVRLGRQPKSAKKNLPDSPKCRTVLSQALLGLLSMALRRDIVLCCEVFSICRCQLLVYNYANRTEEKFALATVLTV